MKYLFFLTLMALAVSCHAQVYGVSISYSSGKAFGGDLFYGKNDSRFHLGLSHQFNGQKNEVVEERESNYGLTKIEDGDFFWSIDLGYSRIIADKWTLHTELSIGRKKSFTSYEDSRFSDGGYSLITDSETKVGGGLNVGYLVGRNIETFIGYHSMKKINFGIRVVFWGQ